MGLASDQQHLAAVVAAVCNNIASAQLLSRTLHGGLPQLMQDNVCSAAAYTMRMSMVLAHRCHLLKKQQVASKA